MLRRTIVALVAGSAVVLSGTVVEARPSGGIWEKTPRIRKKPRVEQEQPSAHAASLPGIATGLRVQNSAGVTLGTVSQVVTASDGSLQWVVITGADGRSYSLMPNQVSVANGVVVTH